MRNTDARGKRCKGKERKREWSRNIGDTGDGMEKVSGVWSVRSEGGRMETVGRERVEWGSKERRAESMMVPCGREGEWGLRDYSANTESEGGMES